MSFTTDGGDRPFTMDVLEEALERLKLPTRPTKGAAAAFFEPGHADSLLSRAGAAPDMLSLGGLRVVTSAFLTERVQFSRSPSRAKRRAARGFPQHFAERPSSTGYLLDQHTLVVHPARFEAMKHSIAKDARRKMDDAMLQALAGGST